MTASAVAQRPAGPAGTPFPVPSPPGLIGGERPGSGPALRGTALGRLAPRALLPAVHAVALGLAGVLAGASGWFTLVYASLVAGLLAADGQHRLRICLRTADQMPRTVAVAALPLVFTAWVEPAAAVPLATLSAALLVALRAVSCAALRYARRRGRLLEPTLIVGAGATAVQVAELLREHPELGLSPRGFLDDRPRRGRPAGGGTAGDPGPFALLAEPAELAAVIARLGIQRVLVCFPAMRDEDLVPLLRGCRPLRADVCVVPRMYELGAAVPRGCLDDVWGIPLIPLRRRGRLGLLAKRGFDVVGAAVLLLVAAPLLLVGAIAVRLRLGAPVLFRQRRITGACRTAEVVKLRSCLALTDADTRWTVPADRCTGLGRWLRATHLDELPQLVNVLRGQMSLVGPRPERPYFAARFAQQVTRYEDRHRMPAGMTGWAQVHGLHGDTSIADRTRFDNHYIEYWSPWLDVVILCRTLAAVRAPTAQRAGQAPSGGPR